MTVVAVRKYEDKIVIAADKQTSWGRSCKTLDASKIYKINDIVLACAGSCKDISLFRMFMRTHLPKGCSEEDIVDLLSEFVEWKEKKTKNNEYVGQIILIIKNVIFNICGYDVEKIEYDFSAIGSGMFLALGAMEVGAHPKEAVGVAIKYSTGCGGEIDVLEIPIKKAEGKSSIMPVSSLGNKPKD